MQWPLLHVWDTPFYHKRAVLMQLTFLTYESIWKAIFIFFWIEFPFCSLLYQYTVLLWFNEKHFKIMERFSNFRLYANTTILCHTHVTIKSKKWLRLWDFVCINKQNYFIFLHIPKHKNHRIFCFKLSVLIILITRCFKHLTNMSRNEKKKSIFSISGHWQTLNFN